MTDRLTFRDSTCYGQLTHLLLLRLDRSTSDSLFCFPLAELSPSPIFIDSGAIRDPSVRQLTFTK